MRFLHTTFRFPLLTIALLGCDSTPEGPDQAEIDAACTAWRDAMLPGDPLVYDGDLATCEPGTLDADTVARTARQVTYARSVAGLPSVSITARDSAQNCALMMHANEALAHDPPAEWACYDDDGATSAALSLLATVPAPAAVAGFLVDPGNEATLGHRRWLLALGLTEIGVGSTDGYSCFEVPETYDPAPGWVAWPPPGVVPIELLSAFDADVSQTGWSVQSDTLDLSAATVRITSTGSTDEPAVQALPGGFGGPSAIRFVPDSAPKAGDSLTVEVALPDEVLTWETHLVRCDEADAG